MTDAPMAPTLQLLEERQQAVDPLVAIAANNRSVLVAAERAQIEHRPRFGRASAAPTSRRGAPLVSMFGSVSSPPAGRAPKGARRHSV
jgi:hypothetical protein